MRNLIPQTPLAYGAPLFVLWIGSSAVQAENAALVIGNGSYDKAVSLTSPITDAERMALSLESLNFSVTLLRDASKQEILDALASVQSTAGADDTVLFYFSGHGFQADGMNYLVPRDATLSDPDNLSASNLSVAAVFDAMSVTESQRVLLLDANRSNPLPLTARSATTADGLAAVVPPENTFVGFATQPNFTTPGTSGVVSPFTEAILTHIAAPSLSILDLMVEVRSDVVTATEGTQLPWDVSSLTSQFYFNPVIETQTVITDADLEDWGALDDDSLKLMLAALQQNGVQIEISDGDEEDEAAQSDELEVGEIRIEIEDPDEEKVKALEQATALFQLDDADVVASESAGPSANEIAQDAVSGSDIPADEDGTENLPTAALTETQTEADALSAAIAIPENLPFAIQTELTRVGCHRAAIDGKWGKISTVSLLRFYAKQGSLNEEQAKGLPTEDAFRALKGEEGVVCTGVQAPIRTATKKKTVKRLAVTTRRSTKKSTPSKSTSSNRTIRPTTTTSPDGTKKIRKGINRGVFQ